MRAEEPALPVHLAPPVTAYAQASREGESVIVALKLVAAPPTTTPAQGISETSARWRDAKVKLGDPGVQVFDPLGRAVASDRVVKALEKKTPVLVAASGELDPFHLLTTKGTTLIFTVPPAVLSPAESVPAGDGGITDLAAAEKAALDLANAERKKLQRAPLVGNPLLTKAARQHSANMAKQGRLEHTLDEKTVGDRLTVAGYVWSRCGENIALGPRTPAEAISAWMSSPGHKENLLSSEFVHIGVATATAADGQPYWTMVLATPLSP
jgi:uncharacterized protein YkwD